MIKIESERFMRLKNLFKRQQAKKEPKLDPQSAMKILNESDDENERIKAVEALRPWQMEELEVLLQTTKDTSNRIRIAAVGSLRGVIFEKIRDGLFEALKDPENAVRESALKNLCEYWPEDAETYCLRIANNKNKEDVHLRCKAIQWLAYYNREKHTQLFIKSLSDAEPEIRKTAVAAISTLYNKDFRDFLEPLLNDPEPAVRAAVCEYYIKHKDIRALNFLKNEIFSPPRLNGPEYGGFEKSLNAFISILQENIKNIPDKELNEYSEMKDINKEMSYYLEDDPRYDAGHDWYWADYSEIRKTAKEELARRARK